jgi:hypothetical protein
VQRSVPWRRDEVTIEIPGSLHENLSGIKEGSGFDSITEFIVDVLRDLISLKSVKKEPSFSPEEIEVTKKKLRSLAYL